MPTFEVPPYGASPELDTSLVDDPMDIDGSSFLEVPTSSPRRQSDEEGSDLVRAPTLLSWLSIYDRVKTRLGRLTVFLSSALGTRGAALIQLVAVPVGGERGSRKRLCVSSEDLEEAVAEHDWPHVPGAYPVGRQAAAPPAAPVSRPSPGATPRLDRKSVLSSRKNVKLTRASVESEAYTRALADRQRYEEYLLRRPRFQLARTPYNKQERKILSPITERSASESPEPTDVVQSIEVVDLLPPYQEPVFETSSHSGQLSPESVGQSHYNRHVSEVATTQATPTPPATPPSPVRPEYTVNMPTQRRVFWDRIDTEAKQKAKDDTIQQLLYRAAYMRAYDASVHPSPRSDQQRQKIRRQQQARLQKSDAQEKVNNTPEKTQEKLQALAIHDDQEITAEDALKAAADKRVSKLREEHDSRFDTGRAKVRARNAARVARLKASKQAAEQAKSAALAEAERIAKAQADRQAKEEADAQDRIVAEFEAFERAELAAQAEERRKAQAEAELVAKQEAERKVREDAEREEREAAELHARLDAEFKAKEASERYAKQIEQEREAKSKLPAPGIFLTRDAFYAAEEETETLTHTDFFQFERPVSDEWNEKLNNIIYGDEDEILARIGKIQVPRKSIVRILGTGGDGVGSWLDDEAVNAFCTALVDTLNEKAGWKKGMTTPPPFAAFATAWLQQRTTSGDSTFYTRWAKKLFIQGGHFASTNTVIFPINKGSHWTTMLISGKGETISYYDSLSAAADEKIVSYGREFIGRMLSDDDAKRWNVSRARSGHQSNFDDCGVFACFNSLAHAMGVTTSLARTVRPENMPMHRRQLAAILLNGGFKGEFRICMANHLERAKMLD